MIVYSFKNHSVRGNKEAKMKNPTQKQQNLKDGENFMYNEMISNLERYKDDVTQLVLHGIRIENENFKKTFFASLESLLNHVTFVRDKKLKEQKIENIYNWYHSKLKYFHDLNDITKKTKKYHYENHPNIEEHKKSDYYEAANFPNYFERENRTEEQGILPPKDRLKNYIRKKITKKEKILKDNSKNYDDKERILSATDSAMRSTNATNFYSTNLKFPNKTEVSNRNDPNNEIKSSFTTYRPQFNNNNLAIEKIIDITKNRELAEKRNKEEMKEFLNEFGINRARFKTDIEKKIETKNLIKFYEKNIENENNKVITDSYADDIKLHYKEENNNSNTNADLEKNTNTILNNNITNDVLSNQNINTDKYSFSNKNSLLIPKLNINSNRTPLKKDSISTDNYHNKRKSISNPNSTENIQNITNIETNYVIPLKINTNNIKNLTQENKLRINTEEVIVNIKTSSSNLNNREKLLADIKSKDTIPSDLMAVNNEKINDMRNKFSKMLNVKDIDTQKDDYKEHFTPLSAYDSVNADVLSISPYEKKLNKNRPLTSYEYVRNNFNCNDLLEQRKTLSGLKFRDMYRLTENLKKNKKHSKIFSQIQEAFLPYEEIIYPKFYLPLPDYGMLSRPIDISMKRNIKGHGKKKI